MNTIKAIETRRSIRKFKKDLIAKDAIQTILNAAILAPSGKNKQPWRFIVVQGEKRAEMVSLMRKGIAAMKEQGEGAGSSERSAKIMEHAPVTIFVFNPYGIHPDVVRSLDQVISDVVDIQSIGASIQNMLLAAQELGIGSVWICDVFYGYRELCEWMGEDCQMIAAVSFGYPDESPAARPRKPVEEVTRWME
jgi:nitroreductase